MAQVLRRLDNLTPLSHPDLIVGIAGSDDAGVFRLDDTTALVQTVDFFTPIVDEADDWGRIAAVNALSDVYAMGGRPITAMQVVGWPRDVLPFDLLGDVMAGAAEVLADAGVTLVGGHSIDAPEPVFGMAVTGLVHPDEVVRNTGAASGDVLFLTKPIGTGLITTAIKRGVASRAMRDDVVAVMTALNRDAAAAAREAGVVAMTDVTGFGLLGHLREMLADVAFDLDAAAVPMIDGALALADAGVVPGGTRRNLDAARDHVDLTAVDEAFAVVLADAQTSGGLLVAVPAARASLFLDRVPGARLIGRFTDGRPGTVRLP